MSRFIFALLAIAAVSDLGWLRAAEVDVLEVDHIMWQDPPVDIPRIQNTFPSQLAKLWSQALARPESELRRTAADTVAIAHQRGVQGMKELAQQLVELLTDQASDVSVRRAAAHALVVIDAQEHAPLLADTASREGYEFALFIEPALAKWQYEPMRSVWLERLKDPGFELVRQLLAVHCLREIKEPQARASLLAITHDSTSAVNFRLDAARALATIFAEGLNEEAKKLSARKSDRLPTERLLAVTLISSHRDDEAITLLREFAVDDEPSVAAVAWNQLFTVAPERTYDLTSAALKSRDVNIRRLAAQTLVHKADAEAIQQVGPILADRNPSLRHWLAKAFVELAGKPELRDVVIATSTEILNGESWQGLEQASLVLVALEQRQTSPRMVELLDHPRREVAVTAAWALRRFQMPEHLPAMLQHAEEQFARFGSPEKLRNDFELIVGQHAQLFQAFGQMKYQEAGPLMRSFVPKRFDLGLESRAAACWALGHLYEGQAPEDLTSQFVERLSDVSSQMPEVNPVRRACAASLGRMKSMTAIDVLRKFAEFDSIATETGQVCYWAIEQLTGEKPPPLPKLTQNILGWFIQPNE